LIGAGTNNARVSQLLKQLSIYYSKSSNTLFIVRLAQGLLYMGKGLVSISPHHSDKFLLSNVSLCGILTLLHCGLDLKNSKYLR
jgi:26S proteasome regulatory subunit N1